MTDSISIANNERKRRNGRNTWIVCWIQRQETEGGGAAVGQEWKGLCGEWLEVYGWEGGSIVTKIPPPPSSSLPSNQSMSNCFHLYTVRPERGGPCWLLKLRANGDSKRTNERYPFLVGLLGLSCRYKRFLFCLGALVCPIQNIFFLSLYTITKPHRPASWAGSRAGSLVS